MAAKMMAGKVEYQLWISPAKRPAFGEAPDQTCHIYQDWLDLLTHLSLMDPIVVDEDNKPNEFRTVTKVVRWSEEKNEVKKKKVRASGSIAKRS